MGIEATTCTNSAELPIRYDKQLLIFRFVFKPVFLPMHVFPSSIWLYCIFYLCDEVHKKLDVKSKYSIICISQHLMVLLLAEIVVVQNGRLETQSTDCC